jgi:hypothetical protein
MASFTFKFQEPTDEPALARLAQRLAETAYASWPLQVEWSRKLPGAPNHDTFAVRRRRLLLCEGGEVRAFHNFFEHELYLDGQSHPFVWPNGELSEGIVDRKYAIGCLMVMQHSLKLQPFHLVMGGAPAFQQILAHLGWKRSPAMMRYLLPLRPAKVLKEMDWFQRTPARRAVSSLLAYSGVGTALGHALSGRKTKRFHSAEYRAEAWDHFGPWADDVWRDGMPTFRAVTRRDAATMNRLYRPGDLRFRRMLVRHRNVPVGWFLVSTQLKSTAEMNLGFGNLRVGALIDTFCPVEHARPLLALAIEQMASEGVDMIFGHWTHAGWDQALRDVGFLARPTAYPFYASPAGAKVLFTATHPLEACHFTDGDCDGPYYVQAESKTNQAQAA